MPVIMCYDEQQDRRVDAQIHTLRICSIVLKKISENDHKY